MATTKLRVVKVSGGGGETPPAKPNVYTSQAEIDKDNAQLKDFLLRHKAPAYFVNNSVFARDVGDKKPFFIGDANKQTPVGATELPYGVTVNDVLNTSLGYGYYHPQTGNFVPVDIQAILSRYKTTPVTKLKVTK